jgi:hypothetical protein
VRFVEEALPVVERANRLVSAAARLAWLVEHPAEVSPRWRATVFVASVERIRSQLRPIPSCGALLESYAREAVVHGALEAAYAARWLELEGVIGARSWSTLCEPPSG